MKADFDRLMELFDRGADLPDEQRGDFLEGLEGSDTTLRDRLRGMLVADRAAESFLETPPQLGEETKPSASGRPVEIGAEIGGYRIEREIAAGGMGIVYEAVQDKPRRRVALKVMRAGRWSASMQKRFDIESEILGHLAHPGIAQVYDAGIHLSDDLELSWFAMELVDGVTLSEFTRRSDSDSHARIEIICAICDAVEHAHSRGVIHRDLKPGNVMVDTEGRPKVLDFGIARYADSELRTTTVETVVGQVVGTLSYMSPEQADGLPDQVDARSDVYALGLLLYEILVGRLPYDLEGKAVHESLRTIHEEEPLPLRRLDPGLSSDVETIAIKALEKDRRRRYASAGALAADLRRFLLDEPIQARPPSRVYRFRKFARRHRGAVASLSLLFIALVIGAAAATWGMLEFRDQEKAALELAKSESHQRDLADRREARARIEAEKFRHMTEFFRKILIAADPLESKRKAVELRDVLDQAAGLVGEEFSGEPETEAALRQTLGDTYLTLTCFVEAKIHLSRALALREALIEPAPAEIAETLVSLGRALRYHAAYDEARGHFERAAAIFRRAGAAAVIELADTHYALAELFGAQGMQASSKENIDLALAIVNGHEARDPRLASRIHGFAGYAAMQSDRNEDARRNFVRAIEVGRLGLPDDHPNLLKHANALAFLALRRGDTKTGMRLVDDALARALHRKPILDNVVLPLQTTRAKLLLQQGEIAAAENLLCEVVERYEKLEQPALTAYAVALDSLAATYRAQNKPDEEGETYARTVAWARKNLPRGHRMVDGSLLRQAWFHLGQGRPAIAEPLVSEALSTSEEFAGKNSQRHMKALAAHGETLSQQGEREAALAIQRQVASICDVTLGPENLEAILAHVNVAAHLVGLDRVDDAEPEFEGLAAYLASHPESENLRLMMARERYGAFLIEMGEHEDAEVQLLAAYEFRWRRSGVAHPDTRAVARQLRRLYDDWDEPEKLEAFQKMNAERFREAENKPTREG